ncbi:uncharacterized protein LOC115075675 [Rhinatrema bivittatum]|uniref:uncharacterized protein LOC115075675 n=1 Tax=Rhinatrema bivittatum TaxID=194408 RepID=UPI00112D8FC0|nr:uncharacterized protein LOC115075675 [Rhinatrema bivittatum]XP_029432154.1 uncharacterized protein LOC115075675 [Rhinatrema bivittatum]
MDTDADSCKDAEAQLIPSEPEVKGQHELKVAVVGTPGSRAEAVAELIKSTFSWEESVHPARRKLAFSLLLEIPDLDCDGYAQLLPRALYDIVIVVFDVGLAERHQRLATHLLKANRCLLLVRTVGEHETGAALSEEERKSAGDLPVQGAYSPRIFQVSPPDQSKFDFPELFEILQRETLLCPRMETSRTEAPASTEPSTPSGEKGDVSVMIAGEAGVGKTSLINAILGLTDGGHQEIVVSQMCPKDPVLHMHPSHPNFFLWKLRVDSKDPASHPEKWVAEADILVLVTAGQFCEWHAAQAKRVLALNKMVYFARSKVDLDLHTAKRKMKANYKELKVLQVLKSIEVEFLQSQGIKDPEIFQLSSYEPYKLDCLRLQQVLKENVRTCESSHRILNSDYVIIDEKEIEEIKAAYERGGVTAVVDRIQHSLDLILNTKLAIGITGESGAGKSSFVNALLGLQDDDPGAAEVGVIECTRAPQEYSHPKYCNVKIWDLPGVGTPSFKVEDYLELVNFHIYDFFIILASERFKENHIKLAKEINKQGKSFYFVRTKVDNDLEAMKRSRRQPVDEEAILEKIRNNCQENLEREGLENMKVFLLSSHKLEKYDFQRFQETMEQELPAHKKQAFLLSLPNLSESIIQKKKQLLSQEIFKLAVISSLVAAVPIPGIAFVCDISMLLARLSTYRKDFDLDNESLAKVAEKSRKSVEELKAVIQSPLGKAINQDLVVHMLSKATGTGLVVANLFFHRIPIFGSVASGGIAFRATYAMLTQALEDLAMDSQRVLVKAFETDV